jgi:glycosyltransferase involved in cell wall biosynthesis
VYAADDGVKISVILSTYNKPHFLERVLWGYAAQTDGDFEVVVADDGSGPETAAVIERMRAATALRIRHVWHEDRGFRKTEILNRAIVAAAHDYLLFSDGDCIPRRDLIAVHRTYARAGQYIAGGYLKLPEEVSEAISVDDVTSGRFARLGWLRAHGWRPGRRALRLVKSRSMGAVFDALTPTSADFQGNNTSAWRQDLIAVNGFEGEMGYGGLDRALGYRLRNYGVRARQMRHRAVCLHLHHERPYRDPAGVRRNEALIAQLKRTKEYRAVQGIAELKPDPTLTIDGRREYGARV